MNPNLTQSGCGAEKERRGHGRLNRERHSTVIAAKPYDSTVGLARRCRPKPQARTPRKKMEFAVRNLAPPYWQIRNRRWNSFDKINRIKRMTDTESASPENVPAFGCMSFLCNSVHFVNSV